MLHLCATASAIPHVWSALLYAADPTQASSLQAIARALEKFSQPTPLWKDLLPTAAAIVVAVATVLVGFYNFGLAPARLKRHEIRLAYVELQLSRLYGPLFAECIRADSIFRRVEIMFNKTAHHHNKDFASLDLSNSVAGSSPDSPGEGFAPLKNNSTLLSWAVRKIYLPSNKRKFALLSHNLHLFGPYPPISFSLFMNHASQMEGLMKLKAEFFVPWPVPADDDASTADSQGTLPTNDPANDNPYMMVPFPFFFTAEVAAKVAFLKALQREYRHRIGKHRDPGEVFSRRAYYLLLHDPDNPDTLSWLKPYGLPVTQGQTIRDVLNTLIGQKNYFIASCPLLWGPYTGMELLELRSWLISKEIPARSMKNLQDQRIFYAAMLNAAVVLPLNRREASKDFVSVPLHYRVAQSFDEIDQTGSKAGFSWHPAFRWSDLESIGTEPGSKTIVNLATRFTWYRSASRPTDRIFLKDLQKPEEFAYDLQRFEEMSEESGFKRR